MDSIRAAENRGTSLIASGTSLLGGNRYAAVRESFSNAGSKADRYEVNT